MTHEHQRWDRDTYVRVLIDQLKDYPRAFAAAKKDNGADPSPRCFLCTNFPLSLPLDTSFSTHPLSSTC